MVVSRQLACVQIDWRLNDEKLLLLLLLVIIVSSFALQARRLAGRRARVPFWLLPISLD